MDVGTISSTIAIVNALNSLFSGSSDDKSNEKKAYFVLEDSLKFILEKMGYMREESLKTKLKFLNSNFDILLQLKISLNNYFDSDFKEKVNILIKLIGKPKNKNDLREIKQRMNEIIQIIQQRAYLKLSEDFGKYLYCRKCDWGKNLIGRDKEQIRVQLKKYEDNICPICKKKSLNTTFLIDDL